MSRPVEPFRASSAPAESHHELEELGTEAIVAHETAAHLPQKRAQVTEEARSIVISEPSAARQPFKVERGEPTVVVERRELEAARKRILQRRKRSGGTRKLLWVALAAAAFAGGALVVFLSTRSSGPTRLYGLSQAMPALSPASEAAPVAAASAAVVEVREPERVPPKVSLEELPLERPRRRQ